jgi:hypothetical protein
VFPPGGGSPEGDRSRAGARPATIEDHVMNENEEKTKAGNASKGAGKRRHMPAEKKYQLFLEAERGTQPLGDLLRREGMYSSDLARIRNQVKEGALDRLRAKPGPRLRTVSLDEYTALKQELEAKERAMADLSVELAILRKKTNGGSWVR